MEFNSGFKGLMVNNFTCTPGSTLNALWHVSVPCENTHHSALQSKTNYWANTVCRMIIIHRYVRLQVTIFAQFIKQNISICGCNVTQQH